MSVTAAIAMALVCGALGASAPSAAAQDDNDPESQRARLEESIGSLEARIGELSAQIDAAAEAVSVADVGLDKITLAAAENEDDRAAVTEARETPAELRRALAVMIYVGGDPVFDSVIDELASGEVSMDQLTDRVLFGAARDEADRQLEDLTDQAEALDETEAELAERRTALTEERTAAEAELEAASTERTQLEAELEEATAQLERLERQTSLQALTGEFAENPVQRPALAVKIDNHRRARPQAGLNAADIVWEEIVEGDLTRLVAVFHSEGAPRVGPVRSARTSDIDILSSLNHPLFGNSGSNVNVRRQVEASTLQIVNADTRSNAYRRDGSRRAPHNLYTSTDALWGSAPATAGLPPAILLHRDVADPAPAGGRPVNGVAIAYGAANVSYTWNGSGWERSIDGAASTDDAGVRVAPPNVIVQFVDYGRSAADARSPEAITVGSGTAWVLTMGQVYETTWSRPDAASPTTYTDASGNEVTLTPGATWIALPRAGGASLR
ncbi:MAG: DUF3048 domain-containing protein [Actinomycetota bacterium]|nr:DUF3048 domain-containing protein [Actinomycetota bacterium]